MFNDAAAIDTTSETTTAHDAAVHYPLHVQALEKIYREEIELRTQMHARVESLKSRLSQVKGTGYAPIEIGGRSGIAVDSACLSAYVTRVEGLAKSLLSEDGAPFTGSLQDYASAAHQQHRDYLCSDSARGADAAHEAFSPLKLWSEISKQFDPDAQRKAANRRAARTIRGSFGMLRDANVQMKAVKGRVEVAMRVYTTTDYHNQRTLSYNSRDHELGEALQQAANDAGLEMSFGAGYAQLCHELREYGNRPIVSRERVDLGDGVDVVLGYETFKLYLPQPIANMLNMFLAENPESENDY